MCLSSGAKEERIVRCSAHAACAAVSPEPASLVCYTHACVLSHLSRVCFFATPWTVARQAPLSLGFSRQEHWSGLPFPSPRDLAGPGVKAASHMSPALADGPAPGQQSLELEVALAQAVTIPEERDEGCDTAGTKDVLSRKLMHKK